MQTIYVKRNRYLAHHGVEGQKWGVRRWQNPDGSLTPEGRVHYGIGLIENDPRDISSMSDKRKRQAYKQDVNDYEKIVVSELENDYKTDERSKKSLTRTEKNKLDYEYEKASIQIQSEAEAALCKKYGEEFINKEKKRDNVRTVVAVGSTLAIMGGVYIATLAASKKMDISL